MIALWLTAALAAPLPTWTAQPWLEDPARVHCLADGTLVAERLGKLVALAPDGAQRTLEGLGTVGELRRIPGGWWLQRRGTTDSAEGQRLDEALEPVGPPVKVGAPLFQLAPCGPDAVVGWARGGPLQIRGLDGALRAERPPGPKQRFWGAVACDAKGQTVYRADGPAVVAHGTGAGLPERWRWAPPHNTLSGVAALRPHGPRLLVGHAHGGLSALRRDRGRLEAMSPRATTYGTTIEPRGRWIWYGRQRLGAVDLSAQGRLPRAETVCPLPDGRRIRWVAGGQVVSGPLEPSLAPRRGIGHGHVPAGLAVDPKAGWLYSSDDRRQVIAWADDGRVRWRAPGWGHDLERDRAVALSPDGGRMYALHTGTLVARDARTGARIQRWALPEVRGAHDLRLRAGGAVAAYADGAGGLVWRHLKTGEVQTMAVGWGPTGDPAFDLSPDGQVWAVAPSDKPAFLAGAPAGARRPVELPRARAVAFSPDGQHLALARPRGGLEVRRVADGAVIRQLADHSAQQLVFTPDGRWLGWGGWSHDLGAWCWAPGCKAKGPTLIDPPWHVSAVAFGPGGHLWSTGADQAVTAWERTTGRTVVTRRSGRAARAHAVPLAVDGGWAWVGLKKGVVVGLPLAGGAPRTRRPVPGTDRDGQPQAPHEATAVRAVPSGVATAHARGALLRWDQAGSAKAARAALTGYPDRVAPLGDGWVFADGERLVPVSPVGQRGAPLQGQPGEVERLVGGVAALVVARADQGQTLRRFAAGAAPSPPLAVMDVGPTWPTPTGAVALVRRADPQTAAEEGDEVPPVWRRVTLRDGRWVDDADFEGAAGLTHDGAPGAPLPGQHVAIATAGGVAVVDRDGGVVQAFWLSPDGGGPVSLAADPTGRFLVAGANDGGVHVFDRTAGRRVWHLIQYDDGDWAAWSADGALHHGPQSRHAP